jgi:hypothetical protein
MHNLNESLHACGRLECAGYDAQKTADASSYKREAIQPRCLSTGVLTGLSQFAFEFVE